MDERSMIEEINRLQERLTQSEPGTDEYKAVLDELRTLQSVLNESGRLNLDEFRAYTDRFKVETDDLKSRREERREYVKIGSSIIGGGLMITLVQLLESEKIIRSKAFQFAAKVVNKVL